MYTMADEYESVYQVGLFDDLHNYLPAVLYEPARFRSVADLLSYIQSQSQTHFNIYNRGQQRYNRIRQTQPPTNGRRAVNVTTHETIDITPLFTTQLPTIRRTAGGGGGAAGTATVTTIPIQTNIDQEGGITLDIGGTPVLDELMNILQQGLLRPRGQNLEPVIVRPTTEQIEHATTIRTATVEDEENNCSVCQDIFLSGDMIRHITHCEHNFHRTCIDPWFTRNVHCPVCRFDIRESE